MRHAKLLVAAAILVATAPPAAVGCGENVLLGGTQAGPSAACAGMACGAPCSITPCADGHDAHCAASAVMGTCATDGTCVEAAPSCPPPPPDPCQGKTCGDPCMPACGPGEASCDAGDHEHHHCNAMGACVDGPTDCPCMGPHCGPPYDPCEGKLCGAMCSPCDPMDPMCMPAMGMACDPKGECVPSMEGMCMPPKPWDPCGMKVCGAMCTLCPPDDPTCMEPPGPKGCDMMGHCLPGMPACGGPGDGGPPPDGGMMGMGGP